MFQWLLDNATALLYILVIAFVVLTFVTAPRRNQNEEIKD